MSHNITVLFVGMSWCHFCTEFDPIFESAKKKIKSSDLDGCTIDLISYKLNTTEKEPAKDGSTEMVEYSVQEKFVKEHPGLIDFVKGYPTVFFKMTKKTGNSRPKIEIIDHTISKDGNIKEAVQEFIQNIINKYKSIISDNKVEYTTVQRGGQTDMSNYMTSLEEVIYRNKYLKYKSKYLKLKNN